MNTISVQKKYRLSGSDLKILACVSMLIDHAALIFSLSGPAALICRDMIGRLAFPIFAFLLVEGFLHTKNFRKYLTGMLLLAILSELPYDFALSGATHFPELHRQNTLFTLSLGLIMLWTLKKAEESLTERSSAHSIFHYYQLLIILPFAALAYVLRLDYSFMGPLCIGIMYLFRFQPLNEAFWGSIMLNLNMLSMPGAFFSVLPISRYDGTRGKQNKYFFYLFYPLHLLLLALLQKMLIHG